MFRNGMRLLGLLIIISILLQACDAGRKDDEPSTPESTNLRVLLLPFMSFAPFFIAEQEGYFTEQGLDVEFVRMERGTEAIPALAQGDIDVYAGAISVSILRAIQDGEIRIVADKGFFDSDGCDYMTFLVRKDLIDAGELGTVEGIRSKNLNMSVRGNIREFYSERLLNMYGLEVDDLELVAVPDATTGEALTKGTMDLAPITEPWATRFISDGSVISWMPAQQVLPGFHFAFIAYGPRILTEERAAGQKFMVAYLNAVKQYAEGKTDRNIDILEEITELDRTLIQNACWSAIQVDGHLNDDDIIEFQNWAIERGMLDGPPMTADDFWDSSFIDYANQELEND
jgi:NitT/TauT family transport system substrate-binding protein